MSGRVSCDVPARVNILINDPARTVRSGPGPGPDNGPIPKPDTPFESAIFLSHLSLYIPVHDRRSSIPSFSLSLSSPRSDPSPQRVLRRLSWKGYAGQNPGKDPGRCPPRGRKNWSSVNWPMNAEPFAPSTALNALSGYYIISNIRNNGDQRR